MTKINQYELLLKQKLAEVSETDAKDWFIVSRARHGMEVVLKKVYELNGEGTVVTQPFTCVTAVNPIIAAGFKPVYCDISTRTLSRNPLLINGMLETTSRAIIVQHSFGIPAEMTEIKNISDNLSKPLIIEDSAHCLGYISKDTNGPQADISIHSFGAEKFLKTSFGGAVWINPEIKNTQLRDSMTKSFTEMPPTSMLVNIRVWLYPRLNGVLNRLPRSISGIVRSVLLATRIFRSPIMPIEQKGINFEKCQRPSTNQLKTVYDALESYETNKTHRSDLTQLYIQEFTNKSDQIQIIEKLKKTEIASVRFPILAKTPVLADKIFTTMAGKGYALGKWYRPLFFPSGYANPAFMYKTGLCPVAEDVSSRIINLPTHMKITPQAAREIAHAIISIAH